MENTMIIELLARNPIRQCRGNRISRRMFATALGMCYPSLDNWECGVNLPRPSAKGIDQLLVRMGISFEELIARLVAWNTEQPDLLANND
jgi:DNA-binding transcriptional regulator YiaG